MLRVNSKIFKNRMAKLEELPEDVMKKALPVLKRIHQSKAVMLDVEHN